MTRFRLFAAAVLAALVLGGCNGPAPTATPQPPTVTPLEPPTLPPTWTPGSDGLGQPSAATTSPEAPLDGATRTPIPGLPTLPPTWTPYVAPTRTPRGQSNALPTFTLIPRITNTPKGKLPFDGPPTPATSAVYDTICGSLMRTTPTDTFVDTKHEAQISWTPVEGAETYQVWILSPALKYIYDVEVTGTTVTIPAETFLAPGLYGWEVMAARAGDRMCPSLTGVFNVRLSRE